MGEEEEDIDYFTLTVPKLRKLCEDKGIISTGRKAELVARLNKLKKSTREDKAEEEEDEEEINWQWADDSATGSQDLWRDYSATLQAKLNKAYQKNQKQVRVDTQRFVDLSQNPYFQRRYDDPSRRRLVQRVVKKNQKNQIETSIQEINKENRNKE